MSNKYPTLDSLYLGTLPQGAGVTVTADNVPIVYA